MDLRITPSLVIPSRDLKWRFSRSSGAGGQNVNKVESRVELLFNIKESNVFDLAQKKQLRRLLHRRITKGYLRVVVSNYRTQYKNREVALIRLAALIRTGLASREKIRRATLPTKSSQRKRIRMKKLRGQLKLKRKGNAMSDD